MINSTNGLFNPEGKTYNIETEEREDVPLENQ